MHQPSPGLVSIGYEGLTSEELFERLQSLRVSVLVDVRLTPLSRKPGLSKTRLSLAADIAGMAYVHLPALGNPKDNRDSFRSGDASAGCIRFSALLARPASIAAMDYLESIARDHLTAVLCFERDHAQCHRQVIVEQMHRRLGGRSEVIHA